MGRAPGLGPGRARAGFGPARAGPGSRAGMGPARARPGPEPARAGSGIEGSFKSLIPWAQARARPGRWAAEPGPGPGRVRARLGQANRGLGRISPAPEFGVADTTPGRPAPAEQWLVGWAGGQWATGFGPRAAHYSMNWLEIHLNACLQRGVTSTLTHLNMNQTSYIYTPFKCLRDSELKTNLKMHA